MEVWADRFQLMRGEELSSKQSCPTADGLPGSPLISWLLAVFRESRRSLCWTLGKAFCLAVPITQDICHNPLMPSQSSICIEDTRQSGVGPRAGVLGRELQYKRRNAAPQSWCQGLLLHPKPSSGALPVSSHPPSHSL